MYASISTAISYMEGYGFDTTKLREAEGGEGEWRALVETMRELARELQRVSLAAEEARRVFRAQCDILHASWELRDARMTDLAEQAEDAAWFVVEHLEKREADIRACLRVVEDATIDASTTSTAKVTP